MKLGMALLTKRLKRGSSRVGELKMRDELESARISKNTSEADFFKYNMVERAMQPDPSYSADFEVAKRVSSAKKGKK